MGHTVKIAIKASVPNFNYIKIHLFAIIEHKNKKIVSYIWLCKEPHYLIESFSFKVNYRSAIRKKRI